MDKLILLLLVVVFSVSLMALQTDEELAVQTLFQVKHAVNRSVHAAAQQLDERKLAEGTVSINPQLAFSAAQEYLQENLRLDENNQPEPHTFLQSPVSILAFEVVDEGYRFPYEYVNETYHYRVTLAKPGVVMIVQVEYPRLFQLLGPTVLVVKGTAETVY